MQRRMRLLVNELESYILHPYGASAWLRYEMLEIIKYLEEVDQNEVGIKGSQNVQRMFKERKEAKNEMEGVDKNRS